MTKLPVSERYFQPEISKVHFLTAIAAATHIPVRAEITAGTDLTDEIADIAGFQVTGADIATPDMGKRFTKSIPGRKTAANSSITVYADLAGADARTVLTEGLNGFMVFMDGGDVPGQPMDVYPVRVKAVGKARSVGDSAMQLVIEFTITGAPVVDEDIPAAA